MRCEEVWSKICTNENLVLQRDVSGRRESFAGHGLPAASRLVRRRKQIIYGWGRGKALLPARRAVGLCVVLREISSEELTGRFGQQTSGEAGWRP